MTSIPRNSSSSLLASRVDEKAGSFYKLGVVWLLISVFKFSNELFLLVLFSYQVPCGTTAVRCRR